MNNINTLQTPEQKLILSFQVLTYVLAHKLEPKDILKLMEETSRGNQKVLEISKILTLSALLKMKEYKESITKCAHEKQASQN